MQVGFNVQYTDGSTGRVSFDKPSGFHPHSLFVLQYAVAEAEGDDGRIVEALLLDPLPGEVGAKSERMTRKQITGREK